ADLRRTTNGVGPVRDVSYDVGTGLDAGSWFGREFASVRTPTLEEFLSAGVEKVDLYLEVMYITPEALVARHDEQHGTDRTVVYIGVQSLQKSRSLNPRLRLHPPLNDPAQLESIDSELHPYAVDTRWEILSKELIDRCHSKGILVFSDSLGGHEKIEDYEKAIGWGIDLIQTDHPLRLLRAIELIGGAADSGRKRG